MPSDSKSKKKVLFVDDDVDFLSAFVPAMELASKGGWEIHSANNAAKALAILSENTIQLAVIDFVMPLVDGLQLLRLVGRKHPQLPKAILTGNPNKSSRDTCLANGADLYLEKPKSSADMETIFAALNELVRENPEVGFQGTLQRVGLHDIVQMQCLGRNSAILEIFNKEINGQVYIKNGTIVHAQSGDLKGNAAFFFLLSISGGGFKIEPFVEPPDASVSKSWEFLLMEASRLRDETNFINRGEDMNAQAKADFFNHAAQELERSETVADVAQEPAVPHLVSQPVETGHAGDLGMHQMNSSLLAADAPLRLPEVRIPTDKFEAVEIRETVVFSSQGEVLLERQCHDIELRKRFLEYVSERSQRLGQGLDLGRFDLLEVQTASSRIVAQIQTEAGIYVEAVKVAPPGPAAGGAS